MTLAAPFPAIHTKANKEAAVRVESAQSASEKAASFLASCLDLTDSPVPTSTQSTAPAL